MQTIQVGQLKHELSSVLELVKGGKEFVVEFGRKHQPVAVILPYSHYKKEQNREFGLLQNKGSFSIQNDFEISDEELLNS
jgi:antitoxin (DNA-binding transcriptional repressor) of toxin-antitoxin stability system